MFTKLKQRQNFFSLLFLSFIFHSSLCCVYNDKWIVVTTIQYPTEELKKLAALPDWHLVVVADKKTPADWHLDNCEFLSVERQLELEYETIQLLPWNHYCRKNIGYLYAIEHGAEIIYETDDDNDLMDGVYFLPEECALLEIDGSGPVINAFAYFGQPTVWPRGYPLDRIAESVSLSEGPIAQRRIGVQQGLIDKDPDVDAIFRLTRESEVYFEDKPTCVIPAGQFCPFNSQNTIFYKSTFWGLFLPSTISMRVCDIWRGYITQRLLWDMGHVLCFTRPTTVQHRNPHNYLYDFREEQDLYLKAGDLAQFLSNWHSESPTIADRSLTLVGDLAKENFLHEREVIVQRAWFNDLRRVGYHFPE
jgi:hypothetical protein